MHDDLQLNNIEHRKSIDVRVNDDLISVYSKFAVEWMINDLNEPAF